MKITEGSWDEWAAAVADLAEVADWSALWGPELSGQDAPRYAERVVPATGWAPDEVGEFVSDKQHSWWFTAKRGTRVDVFGRELYLPVDGGWRASGIAGEQELAEAVRLSEQPWQQLLELARSHWGDPAHVERDMAGWQRAGARFGIRREGAARLDPELPAISFSLSCYGPPEPGDG